MNRKSPVKAPAQKVQQASDDPWRSGRARFGRRNFRRGSDHRWHFPGQQPGEKVIRVLRKHKLFLVFPALPAIGTFVVLILLLWASTRFASLNLPWIWLELVDIAAMVFFIIWFIWRDGVVWYLETYIITNKRIISSRGLLEPTRQSTPVEKIKQVGVDLDNFWGFLFRFGVVHIYLQGSDLILRDVPSPMRVKEVLDVIIEDLEKKKPKPQKAPTPEIPQVASEIDRLSKAKEPPHLEDADEHYAVRHPERRIGPRRTFGGILRIPCDVRYMSGEHTVRYIQRSRFVLYRKLLLSVALLLLLLPLAIYGPASGIVANTILGPWWLIAGVAVLALVVFIGLTYTNWADDVYILSTRRVIDIDRRFIFFYEMREEVEYKNIRDVKVKVHNALERLLDIGDVSVELAGTPGVILKTVDHPFLIQDKIYEIQKFNDKLKEVEQQNKTKAELKDWFDTVVSSLLTNTQLNGAPNLCNLELLEAMERANELGFLVVVEDEEASSDGRAPGTIVYQSPPAGTAINLGGEILVILRR
ncbi:MAG TPA: PH domain-containing protein [Ktedonobacteraceae bacterium]|nr:PH domain-containing protein [Ktedonobacteraceae bacterium]